MNKCNALYQKSEKNNTYHYEKINYRFFLLRFGGTNGLKKEKNVTPGSYYEIKIEHIAALESSMSGQLIEAVNTIGALILKPGDVIVYKTNIGRLGKMKIVSINSADNYKLSINAETYNADGSTYQSKTNVEIRGTWVAELDEIVEASNNSLGDFFGTGLIRI